MREIINEIETWQKENKPVAIATNVKKEGASLRPLGAKMAVTPFQEIAGSVTGGCIEGAVYEEAQEVINNGQPKLLHYGVVSEESPWEVGLSCGGTLDVLIEKLDSPGWCEIYPALVTCLKENKLAAVATVISGSRLGNKMMICGDGKKVGSLGNTELDVHSTEWIRAQILRQETKWNTIQAAGEQVELFVDVFVPAARLIIIGAVHIAIPLIALAKTLGFHTIVIDPRKAFATRERFPLVDELITEWPSTALQKLHIDEGTYIAALSHDEKLDNPALQIALTSPARYVGVLGTRKNFPKRAAELKEMGVSEAQLERLQSPIGMNLGAVLPDEIALSILAEVVAARHGIYRNQETQLTTPVSVVS
jgi:xanthine dehydrogenase accessory factor